MPWQENHSTSLTQEPTSANSLVSRSLKKPEKHTRKPYRSPMEEALSHPRGTTAAIHSPSLALAATSSNLLSSIITIIIIIIYNKHYLAILCNCHSLILNLKKINVIAGDIITTIINNPVALVA